MIVSELVKTVGQTCDGLWTLRKRLLPFSRPGGFRENPEFYIQGYAGIQLERAPDEFDRIKAQLVDFLTWSVVHETDWYHEILQRQEQIATLLHNLSIPAILANALKDEITDPETVLIRDESEEELEGRACQAVDLLEQLARRLADMGKSMSTPPIHPDHTPARDEPAMSNTPRKPGRKKQIPASVKIVIARDFHDRYETQSGSKKASYIQDYAQRFKDDIAYPNSDYPATINMANLETCLRYERARRNAAKMIPKR